MTTLLLIVALALSISFLCSILEAVFLSTTHSYIAVLKGRGEWAGAWLEQAQRQVEEPIAAILTLNTIAHTVGATLAGAQAAVVFGDAAVGVFSGVLTLAVLIVTEIIPKTVGASYWKVLAIPTAHVLRWMIVGMKPVLVPLSWMSRLITPNHERPTVSRAELEVLAEIGRREGTLAEDEFSVVSNVIRLGEVSIREVMTPRADIEGVSADATLEDVQARMRETGHFRLPVYDGNLDRILGVVLARDVLWADRAGETGLSDVIRPVPFAPVSKPVEDLIPEMRAERAKMAIVVDEFGGTAGLVTLEDLLEEIVGEIQDEHEGDEPAAFRELENGSVRVWGRASLRDAARQLGLDPTESEDDHYDTVAGFVFGRLNRIPTVGDEVEVATGTLRVTRMSGRRIRYLLFTPRGSRRGSTMPPSP